jgi:foldase protein PrsA
MLPNNKKGQARWLMLLVVIMIVSMLSACGKNKDAAGTSASPGATPAHKDSEIAATYKGGKITYGELNKFIKIAVLSDPTVEQYKDIPGFQEDTLKRMVTYKIISATISDKAKTDADAVVKQQMDGIKAYTGEQKTTFDANLKQAGLKTADLQWFIELSARPQFEMVSKVTDQQVKDFYDKILKESPATLVGTVTLNHILIATKDPADTTGVKQLRTQDEALKIAKDVQDQLKKGGDFVVLAKKYSDDAGSKDKGGRYDNYNVSQFVAAFGQAAAELPLNTISDPILTEFGYHVMKVESRTTKTLAEVTEAIKQNLASTQIQKFMTDELPKNEYKSNIPTPTPAPSSTPAPSAQASPTATPVK